MAEFSKLVITGKGSQLVMKILENKVAISFTKIAVSSRMYTIEELGTLISLDDIRQENNISEIEMEDAETIKIHTVVPNTNLTEGYFIKTIGLYASDPDDGEILYGVSIETSENGCYVPPYNNRTVSNLYFNMSVKVGNSENVSLEVDQGAVVTVKQLNKVLYPEYEETTDLNDLESSESIFTAFGKIKKAVSSLISHLKDTENPHKVNAEQVGLDKVPNVATNDQTPTFTQAATRANIASGEKLSVLFGKIAKWFTDLKTVAFSGSYNDLTDKPAIGICDTAQGTAAKTVDCPDFELCDGARVMVTFQNGNTSNYMTLNVNNTGAYFAWFPVGTNRTYNDELISKFIIPGCAYEFIFQEAENAKDSKWVYCGINYQTMTGVKGNAESSYRTGNVNLTAANIGAVPLTGGTMSGSLVVNAAARLNGITNAYTNVPDNSGFPKYLKMVDITDWYNSTGTGVAKRGFVGTIYTQRSGGSLNSCDRICQLIVSAAYKKTTVEDGTCLTLRTSGDFEPCILCDETALKYYLAIKVKRSSCQMYIQGVFVGDFVNSWVNTTDSTGTMPDGYSIVCNDYKPITTKSHYEWMAHVTCTKWSRLCHVAPRTGWGITGSKYIISIAATRTNVLYHDTFLVTYHHEKKGSIIKLSGSGYSSGYKVRIVSENNGNYGYFELYDNLEGATSSAVQTVRCALLPLESDVVTTYSTFTSGVTIPGDCTVAQELTVEDTEMQGTISNSVKAESATKLDTARTIQTNLASTSVASFDGSANTTPGVTGILSVSNGGTGATTASNARSNLGLGTAATYSVANNLTTTTSGSVLDARQGKVLSDAIDAQATASAQTYALKSKYGDTTIDVGREENTLVGEYSAAEGYNTEASGDYSHAEGWSTIADVICAHAEGCGTYGHGDYCHVEGYQTSTNYNSAHAEGYITSADANYSHTEGFHTQATTPAQHVQGMYNTTNDNYIDIIGYGSSTASKNIYTVDKSGNVTATSFSSTGGDYAEFWEWFDGNPEFEDRVGHFVTFNCDKIRLSQKDDPLCKMGVISATPSVVGDSDQDEWTKMYMTDLYGRVIYQDVTSEDGTVTKEPMINPDWDNTQAYIKRADRPEWDAVGTHGKLIVIDDGTCQPDGFCVPADGGIATAADDGFYVMERLDESHIRIYMR